MNIQSFSAALTQFVDVLEKMHVSDVAQPAATNEDSLQHILALLRELQQRDGSVYLIGNGGSAAIVAHMQNDLVNKARLRAHVLHESSLLTCMSNDYGYDKAYAEILDRVLRPGDLLIAVSSSGRSRNMLNAVEIAQARGAKVLTLTGFSAENPLRASGHFNIWLPSSDYGEVEVGHQLVLHYLADALTTPL